MGSNSTVKQSYADTIEMSLSTGDCWWAFERMKEGYCVIPNVGNGTPQRLCIRKTGEQVIKVYVKNRWYMAKREIYKAEDWARTRNQDILWRVEVGLSYNHVKKAADRTRRYNLPSKG